MRNPKRTNYLFLNAKKMREFRNTHYTDEPVKPKEMRKRKIKITYSRYEHTYKIVLLEQIDLLIFPSFWWPVMTMNGTHTLIGYYRDKWKKEFGLMDEDVEDKTK